MSRRPPTLTTRQLADALGVSESSIKRWVDDGTIPAGRTAGGHRRIATPTALSFIRRTGLRPKNPRLLALATIAAPTGSDADTREALFRALHDDDADTARTLLGGRFLAGTSIARIADEMIQPVFERLGGLWRDDPAGILIEHRAVQSCARLLYEMSDWFQPLAANAPVAITAAAPGDSYLLPSLLASLTLRECGMRAVNLGPDSPPSAIGRAAP